MLSFDCLTIRELKQLQVAAPIDQNGFCSEGPADVLEITLVRVYSVTALAAFALLAAKSRQFT